MRPENHRFNLVVAWAKAQPTLRPLQLGIVALLSAFVSAVAADQGTLRLATTSTTDNSGLVQHLIPVFERDSGYRVQVITVGSGRALRLLENGDVDVALTHAHALEQSLVTNGRAIDHFPVMYNDFILVGPHADPAAARTSTNIQQAFRRIAGGNTPFFSRGDQSGTHLREWKVWREISIEPDPSWYRETGQGMGQTLQIASELGGYTLTDRATWLAYRHVAPLALLHQGDEALLNPYSVLSANPDASDGINAAGAKAFSQWLRSVRGKKLIGDFRIEAQQAFIPAL